MAENKNSQSFVKHLLENQENEFKLIETHISFLLIGKQYTYKIKKAITLPFLDFSTLDQRKYYIERELALNKINCPNIYLSISYVYKVAENKWHLSDDLLSSYTLVDYALKMNTFSQEHVFSKQKQLITNHIESLTTSLVDLHTQKYQVDASYIDYGTSEAVCAMALENLDQSASYIGQVVDNTTFQQIRSFTVDFTTQNKGLFADRIKNNKIKGCHGDLHLGNICLYNNEIQFFDCIEFNTKFRYIDVIYDLAFLYMDLSFRGYTKEVNYLLNKYIELTNDVQGVRLLNFYANMRAVIRAKVNCILSHDSNASVVLRQQAQTDAKAYFLAASQFITKYNQAKSIVLMSGLSGTGKSTLAYALAKHCEGIVLRTDSLRKHMANTALNQKLEDKYYTSDFSSAVHQKIAVQAISLYKSGFTVFIDATFLNQKNVALVNDELRKYNIVAKTIYCYADENTVIERIKNRKNDVSDADLSIYYQQKEGLDKTNFHASDFYKHAIKVDMGTSINYTEILSKI